MSSISPLANNQYTDSSKKCCEVLTKSVCQSASIVISNLPLTESGRIWIKVKMCKRRPTPKDDINKDLLSNLTFFLIIHLLQQLAYPQVPYLTWLLLWECLSDRYVFGYMRPSASLQLWIANLTRNTSTDLNGFRHSTQISVSHIVVSTCLNKIVKHCIGATMENSIRPLQVPAIWRHHPVQTSLRTFRVFVKSRRHGIVPHFAQILHWNRTVHVCRHAEWSRRWCGQGLS